MALTLVATAGAANANSYLTEAEAESYYESRPGVVFDAWDDADSKAALLVMATRVLDAFMSGRKMSATVENKPVIRTRGAWTGVAATAVQSLAWPRIGMLNRNGFAIAETAIPQELKDAVAELAGQLARKDTTLDNSNAIQGITSAKAGSVSVSYGDSAKIMLSKPVPEMVLDLLVPSWFTDETIVSAYGGIDFEVMT